MQRNLTTIVLFFLAYRSVCIADDWPQWRGPTRDCHIGEEGTSAWPDSLDADYLTKTWSVSLGPSYSGPIVVGDRVFVTETRNKSHEIVRAFHRQTGGELWTVEWPGAITVPFFAAANGSWIRSTPACDGTHLFVMGIREVLVALEVQTGKEAWRIDFVSEFGGDAPAFGAVCSPLIDGEAVYVQAVASTLKVRKSDGEVLWRSQTEGVQTAMDSSPFSSPVIAEIAGKRQLIVQSRSTLQGIALDSGKPLWARTIPATRNMNILTPLVHDDSIFTSAHGGSTFLFNVKGDADGDSVTPQWSTKQQAYMSSPTQIGNDIYLHMRNQRLTCLNMETGQTNWTTKPFGKYWSMVVNGDRIVSLDERGELRLIRANSNEYQELSTRKVSTAEAWAHLAVAGPQVFVRDLDSLTVWNWKTPNTPSPATRSSATPLPR